MADIFVSYSKIDRNRVKPIMELLEAQGWRVWWDQNIDVGEPWRAKIERELRAAKCVVVVWTPSSISSEWVKQEADEGLRRGILIPVSIGANLAPLGLRHIQAIDLTSWRGEFDADPARKLVAGVRRVLVPRTPIAQPASQPQSSVAGMGAMVVLALIATLVLFLFQSGPTDKKPPGPDVPSVVKPATPLTVAQEQALKPRDTFKECDSCPELVVVPAGEFIMGSPESEALRYSDNERPQRKVTIAQPFAVGKFEVTLTEWDACVTGGGCKRRPANKSWPREQYPVTDVSWDDATQEYLPWLSRTTGKTYRLLTEAEWEYAARAGTTSPYWWGAHISLSQANFKYFYPGGRKAELRGETVVVDSFQPNPWGLYNVHGNAWEWVQDCLGSYAQAPLDGRTTPDVVGCSRVLRGGHWDSAQEGVRSASRHGIRQDRRSTTIGFRVARTIGTAAISSPAEDQALAHKKADEEAWLAANQPETLESLRRYLHDFANGQYAPQARQRIAELESQKLEDEVWAAATNPETINSLQNYLKKYPTGRYAHLANQRIARLTKSINLKPTKIIAHIEALPPISIMQTGTKIDGYRASLFTNTDGDSGLRRICALDTSNNTGLYKTIQECTEQLLGPMHYTFKLECERIGIPTIKRDIIKGFNLTSENSVILAHCVDGDFSLTPMISVAHQSTVPGHPINVIPGGGVLVVNIENPDRISLRGFTIATDTTIIGCSGELKGWSPQAQKQRRLCSAWANPSLGTTCGSSFGGATEGIFIDLASKTQRYQVAGVRREINLKPLLPFDPTKLFEKAHLPGRYQIAISLEEGSSLCFAPLIAYDIKPETATTVTIALRRARDIYYPYSSGNGKIWGSNPKRTKQEVLDYSYIEVRGITFAPLQRSDKGRR